MTDQEYLPAAAPVEVPGTKRRGGWTCDDYAALPDDGQRYEIIDEIFFTAPTPGAAHQITALSIASELLTHVQHTENGRYARPGSSAARLGFLRGWYWSL